MSGGSCPHVRLEHDVTVPGHVSRTIPVLITFAVLSLCACAERSADPPSNPPQPQAAASKSQVSSPFASPPTASQPTGPSAVRPPASSRKPDVILISIDTLRRDHLSIYGYKRDTAPNLEAFAKSAVIFDRAIAAHTNTSPSHASMLTGLYPPTHGVLRNRYRLRDGVKTLAEILRSSEYVTGAFVSSIMLNHRLTGLGRGFDWYDDGDPMDADRQAEKTFRRASVWLKNLDRAKPIFLFFHLFDPHYPYRAPEPFGRYFLPPGQEAYRFPENADLWRIRSSGPIEGEIDEYVNRYDGEIRYADHYVGLLFDTLKALDRFENSVIVFVSDHGETLGERPFAFDHGGRAYDEQIRVPLVFRLPGGALGGQRVEADTHHVDLAPTLLALLKLPIPAEMEGVPLTSAMATGKSAVATGKNAVDTGVGPAERPMFSFARPEPERVPGLAGPMVREGLVLAMRMPSQKLISYPTRGEPIFELFDLASDPEEERNLAAKRPETVRQLYQRMLEWRAAHGGELETQVPQLSPDDEARLRALGYSR